MISPQLYLPTSHRLPTEDHIWRWYNNISHEIRTLRNLSEAERELFTSYYVEAGLLSASRRQFFRRHYSDTVTKSIRFLFQSGDQTPILDLGCGVGTQSLLFAALGARVYALDADEASLQILEKRKLNYERMTGMRLPIDIHCTDSIAFDYSSIGPFKGVFSMFAFNMMQPSRQLISKLDSAALPGARIVLLDGNNRSWLARALPSRRRDVLGPRELRAEFELLGWHAVSHTGAVSLPPMLWNLFPRSVMRRVDNALNRTWLIPVSQLIMIEKTGPQKQQALQHP